MMDTQRELVPDPEKVTRMLKAVTEETGYPIVQHHGQRLTGPPPDWSGPEPERGSELYCYLIPRDCFEDELVPLFLSAGRLYQVRMMVEFSGANRGYCYLKYSNPTEAEAARVRLDSQQVRPGVWLACNKSVDNKKISVKIVPHLPPGFTDQQILQEIREFIQGVLNVKKIDIRWLEVDFESHRAAALARRILVPGEVKLFNFFAIKQVDWAEPDMEGVNKEPPRKKIFLKGFHPGVREESLRDYFNKLCQGQVEYIMTGPIHGFITFHTPEAAQLVMERKGHLRLGGMKLIIDWWVPKKRESDDSWDSQPRPVLQSVNRPLRQPQPVSSPPHLGELLHLTRVRGWGDPQYSLTSIPGSGRSLLYQYSVTFPAVPFKISGLESFNKHQAFINCAQLALRAISQERVPRQELLRFKYIPLSPPPSLQSASLPNIANLRI